VAMIDSALTIGAAARLTGLPVRTIRFYEEAGLLPAPARAESGYRVFAEADLSRLRLIRRARILGLGLAEIRELVGLAFGDSCASFETRLSGLVDRRLGEVRATIDELRALETSLVELAGSLGEVSAGAHACRAGGCERCTFIDD